MAIAPINVTRISQNLRAFNLLRTMRTSQVDLFRTQNQIATGLKFLAPSENPTAAAAAGRLDRRLDILRQTEGNLRDVNATLRAVESAIQEGSDLLIHAHTLAIEATSDGLTADEREAVRVEIDSLINELISVGNRQHLGTFMFSGHIGNVEPFTHRGDGILFQGDEGRREAIVDGDLSQDIFTISGRELFNAISDSVQGFIDLDPALTSETLLADLRGATGTGVDLGQLQISDGTTQVQIDLSGAVTVGDVVDRLNADMPATLIASLTDEALVIASSGRGPVSITVVDIANGQTAVDLGIYSASPNSVVTGSDLDPRLTTRTRISDLNSGAGVNLVNGLTIRNGQTVAAVDFTGAETVEDILNRINQTEAGVWARISDDGSTIDVVNRVSGTALSIEENGGTAASALGIRSMYAGTLLNSLNDGLGIDSVDGDDIRFTTADGTTIDIDIDALNLDTATLQDVIDSFNTAGGGAILASLATSGNGLVIQDNTAGGGTLTIERLNISPALDSLGLNVVSSGGQLVGSDVNPILVDSPFTALLELRTALSADDAESISLAGTRLERSLKRLQQVQGQVAATARVSLNRAERVESELTATRVLRSDVADADLTEAIVRFQQVQTALQANLSTASRILNLSLLDFLQ